MHLRFSASPGRWERHLQRRRHNILFGAPAPEVSQEDLEHARTRDAQEIKEFQAHFEHLIQQATTLQSNEDSEVVLNMKEELDKTYEQAAGLAGDHSRVQDAIQRLLGAIMGAIRRSADNDSQALMELEQEDIARTLHFQLLQSPLVADLLTPQSPIETDELLPSLLSAPAEEFSAAINLFDPAQLQALLDDGHALMAAIDSPDETLEKARLNLDLLTRVLATTRPN